MNEKKVKSKLLNREYILDAIILLVIVQVARIVIKYILLSQLNFTYENVNISNIISMILVGVSMSLILKDNNLFNSPNNKLTKLNNRYNNKYKRLILGVVTLVSICISPYFKGGYVFSNIIVLILYLVVEPIFEEIIFREYLWNYISNFQKNQRNVLIITTILSALFKIGYWDIVSQNISTINSSFFTIDIITSKVFLGVIVAFVLGLVKIRYKDTYICGFIHSFMNIFC